MTAHKSVTTTIAPSVQHSLTSLYRGLPPSSWGILAACFLLLGVMSLSGSKKGKLARGRFGGKREKENAKRVALTQMRERRHNAVPIWVGTPSNLPFGPSPIYLPDAQRGTIVIGAPGSGKTASVIDQAAYSVIEQGHPILMWDFKYPTQTSRIAGYAHLCGYNVHVIAPGKDESATLNPIKEFLTSEHDSLMARQFSEVLNANFKRSGHTTEDSYFASAGDQALEGLLMLARGSKYPDIMMAQALSSVTDLANLLIAHKDKVNPWIMSSFGQLIASAKSEKTVASILGTANLNLTRLIKSDLLPALCGDTTVPTFLEGKQLLILGLDREKRDVISPLIATILHLLIARNVTRPRKSPLFFIADELPTLFLPALVHWLNENREDGLCSILGFQNIVQMEKLYGRELARAILGACATKIIFNPQDYDSAKLFSSYIGETEIRYKTRSSGSSAGKGSTNTAEHVQVRSLMTPDDLLHLPTGRGVIINPSQQHQKDAYIPILESIPLSREYKAKIKKSTRQWDKLRKELIAKNVKSQITDSDLRRRYEEADRLLPPLPKAGATTRRRMPIEEFLDDPASPLYST